MRTRVASLTSRGRALVAAGVTAGLCGVLLGQPGLTSIGLLVALATFGSSLAIGTSRYQLTLVRSVEPRQVEIGHPATVSLQLTNTTRARAGSLRLEDQVPWALGARPRFVVPGLSGQWERSVEYSLRSDVRGRFTLGPLTARITDPFGLAEVVRSFQTQADLVVTPPITALPVVPQSGAWTGAGDNRPRAFALGSAEDVTVREYRHGDALRRVHWRSSARTGELMVRREEQPWQSRATVLLDNRSTAHRGHGPASSLETAVSIAASVIAHLAGRGFVVRLVTATGAARDDTWHERTSATDAQQLLEELAVLEASRRSVLEAGWITDTARTGLLIAVLGETGDHDHAALRRMLHHADTALAFTLDAPRWAGKHGDDPAARLRTTGWRAVTVAPGAHLPSLWTELAASPRGRGAR